MNHIANIFVGESLKEFQKWVLRKTVSQYAFGEDFRQFCRFFRLTKANHLEIAELTHTIQNLFEEGNIEEDKQMFDTYDKLSDYWNRIHTEMVQVGTTHGAAELKVFVYVCLDNQADCLSALHLAEKLKSIKGKQFVVDFIGLDADLVHAVFQTDTSISEKQKLCEASKQMFVQFEAKEQFRGVKNHFFVLQNTAFNGASYNFDENTLADILSELTLMALENYDQLFPISVTPGEITGVGLSRLALDKSYFVKYLMRKAYIKVLADEGIEQKAVERATIDPIVQQVLSENVNVFSLFYDQHIQPLIERNMPHDQIIAAVTPKLKKHFKELEQKFLSFLSNDNDIRKADGTPLSIPEKQAALALLLDIDDQLITGAPYSENLLTFDDIYTQAATTIVDGNNQLVTEIVDEDEKKTVIPGPIEKPIDPESKYAVFPVTQLKALRREILATTENIRKWERQLDNTEEVRDAESLSKRRLTKDGFVFGDTEYRLIGKSVEEPLQDTYVPENVKIRKSVDLRHFFTEVKNQGALGSCTTFAVTSIYEYLLKKKRIDNPDLSERFVFYHTNVLTGKTQEGATYKTVIDTIADKGICNENLCPYIIDAISEQPTSEAYSQAQTHKIVEAKMVKVDHHDITAALSQGYPVAISLQLYNGFGSGYKGFEILPEDSEIRTDEHGYHAMVICGYSEEDHVYIVRNSWGESFGDNGYCYIPFSYIDNPDYNAYCCIITKTDDGEVVGLPDHKTTVNLVKEDVLIQNALLRIKIDETKHLLEELMKKYRTQQSLFIQLIHAIETTRIRTDIVKGVTLVASQQISEAKQKRAEMMRNFTAEMEEVRSQSNKQIIYSGVLTALFALLTFATIYFQWGEYTLWTMVTFLAFSLIALVLFISDKKHKLDRKRSELNARIGNLARRIDQMEKEKTVINLKHHLAGMMIDEISELKSNLKKKYENVVSYVNNITGWYEEEKDYYQQMDCNTHIPVIGLLDNTTLDNYFDQHGDEIMKGVRFSDYLSGYEMGDEQIVEFRDRLRNIVVGRLMALVDDFNVVKFLNQPAFYTYINGGSYNMKTLLPKMNDLSLPFINLDIMVPGMTPSLFLFYHRNEQNLADIRKYFTNLPSFIPMDAKEKIVLISTLEISNTPYGKPAAPTTPPTSSGTEAGSDVSDLSIHSIN